MSEAFEPAIDVRVERVIEAPAARLYELVSDLTRMGEWSPENLGSVWVEGAPRCVGSRFVGRNRSGGREWEGGGVVIAAVPGREFAWTMGDDPTFPRGTWRYTFEETGGSATRVVERYELGPAPSGFRDTVTGLPPDQQQAAVQARGEQLRDAMETTLQRLADHAEP